MHVEKAPFTIDPYAQITLHIQAGATVTLLGRQDDAVVRDHLERCRAFLYAGEEDFGIVPVEAMAAGAPVVAFGRGGLTETVVEGATGTFFHEQNAASLMAAIERCEAMSFDAAAIRRHAERFRTERFQQKMADLVAEAWEAHQQSLPLPEPQR